MKQYFTLLIGASVAIAATAAPRTQQQAMALAAQKAAMQGATLMAPHSQMITAMPNHMGNGTIEQPYYAFDKVGGGYIIVSGEDSMPAIVGYTHSGSFDPALLPDGLKYYLDAYAALAAQVAAGEATMGEEVENDCPVVDPLLGNIEWDQPEPYNLMCPIYTVTNQQTGEEMSARCLTGCAATAAAQIMCYHKYAVQVADIPGYVTSKLEISVPAIPMGEDYANLFDWENMQPKYKTKTVPEGVDGTEEEKFAVSKLMAYVGFAQEMDYTPSLSSANNDGIFASFALLGYDTSLLQLANRRDYTKSHWLDMINNELRHERPILYTGIAGDMGHAFVLDGCDADGLYHINWGWNGVSNGNFDIDILDPHNTKGSGASQANVGYTTSNAMVLGITPQNVAGEEKHVPDFPEPDYSKLEVELSMADGTTNFYYNPYYDYSNQMTASIKNNLGRELNDALLIGEGYFVSPDSIEPTQAHTTVPINLKDGESVVQNFDLNSVNEECDLCVLCISGNFDLLDTLKVDMMLVGLPDLELSLESNGSYEITDERGVTTVYVNDTVVNVDFKIINNGAAYRGKDFTIGLDATVPSVFEIPEGESHFTYSAPLPEDDIVSFKLHTSNVNLPTTSDYWPLPDYRFYQNFARANDITGIQQVRHERQTTGRRYNLQGQVVGEGYRGLFITK